LEFSFNFGIFSFAETYFSFHQPAQLGSTRMHTSSVQARRIFFGLRPKLKVFGVRIRPSRNRARSHTVGAIGHTHPSSTPEEHKTNNITLNEQDHPHPLAMPPQMPIAPEPPRTNATKGVKATKHRRVASMKWCPVTQRKFRIGIIVGSRNMGGVNRVLAIANPASSCCVVGLTFLDPDEANVDDWCKRHKKVVDTIPRDIGLDQLLQNPVVDGVYITGCNQ
jgi:hypothetical protein